MNDPNHLLQLGDAELDEQHGLLEDLIRGARAAAPENRLQALDALRAHAAEHFSAEDRSLRAMADGNARCHLDEHAAVLKSMDEVRAVLVDDAVATNVKTSLLQRLGTQLLAWLPEHVHAMDAGVATYRTKERFGGAPIVLKRPPSR